MGRRLTGKKIQKTILKVSTDSYINRLPLKASLPCSRGYWSCKSFAVRVNLKSPKHLKRHLEQLKLLKLDSFSYSKVTLYAFIIHTLLLTLWITNFVILLWHSLDFLPQIWSYTFAILVSYSDYHSIKIHSDWLGGL